MSEVHVANLSRRYGNFVALHGIDFTVRDGEFLTLLGPSGCGKSTTLAAIAGLDKPTGGLIRVGGEDMFCSERDIFVSAERRNLGLVFQSYALWPHMTVAQNVGFPLKLRKVPSAKARELIHEALALVEMHEFADRYPGQLSGGQQQRVALARTLVYKPRVLLLDEPLSNLDAKLRDRARTWLRHLQGKLGITTIYVTHDQIEALTLSDRIAVMNGGRIVQMDTPSVIYQHPQDPFVADFIGTSNFLKLQVVEAANGSYVCRLGENGHLTFQGENSHSEGDEIIVAIRPEKLQIARGAGENMVVGNLVERNYTGARWLYVADVDGQTLRIETEQLVDGDEIGIYVPPSSVSAVFPGATPGVQ